MVFGSVCHSEQTTAPADDDADEGGGEDDDDGAGAERQIRVVGLGHQRSHRTVHLLSGNVGIMNCNSLFRAIQVDLKPESILHPG